MTLNMINKSLTQILILRKIGLDMILLKIRILIRNNLKIMHFHLIFIMMLRLIREKLHRIFRIYHNRGAGLIQLREDN